MSIFIAQLVPEGMLFAADRNVTTIVQDGRRVVSGQSQRPKVLRWPNREMLLGYVGLAQIEGEAMDAWLYRFIGRHLTDELPSVARSLKEELERDLSGSEPEPLVIHLGAFEPLRGQWVPRIWFLRNTQGIDEYGDYYGFNTSFDLSEELGSSTYFGDADGDQIRSELETRARAWQPFWFHQGFDLGTFNTLDEVIRNGMSVIAESHPRQPHRFPDSVEEWEKHLRMAVLTYGAYFAAFYEPFEQFVGGGADVVSAERPPAPPIHG